MIDRMKMQTSDRVEKNIEIIQEYFPACITEILAESGEIKKGVNFDLLKQFLSSETVEGQEFFGLNWVGKKQSVTDANTPIRKTLRPQVQKSLNWDTTENIYIEGDNLDALKLLQESYLEGIKLIYIDPPYNTGNDFIYNDSFQISAEEYRMEAGGAGAHESGAERAQGHEADAGTPEAEGGRMTANPETDGRFHSRWCSMMFSRLLLARNLLSRDGVIFISIDDNEVENLKLICNEVFGRQNFEGHIHWRRRHNQPNDKTKMLGIVAEHILVYAKDSAFLKKAGVGKLELTASFTNADQDPRGPWASKPWKTGSDQSGSRYRIVTPTGKILEEEWMGDEATYQKYLEEGRIYFPRGGDGMPRKKYYQSERENEGQCATNWWPHEQFGHNQGANDCMTDLFGVKNIFSNPKPIELLKAILRIANVKDGDTVLDFFSGSATTAHALLQLNAEDQGRRKFILIQMPEKCAGKSEAYKNNYTDICEIGRERIKRAGRKIRKETNVDIDYGFRSFCVDTGNRKEEYYTADEYTQPLVAMLESNLREDRSELDLLFGCLTEWGLPLSLPYRAEKAGDCTIHNYNEGELIACFQENLTEEAIEAIAARRPRRAVFRDSCFADSCFKMNAEEIFKLRAPDTSVKVI